MTNKNYLTTEAYTEMALEITDILDDLRLMASAIEFIKHPQQVTESNDVATEYYKVFQYTQNLYQKIDKITRDLENIGGTLYSVSELNELKGYVKDEWLKDEEINVDETKN